MRRHRGFALAVVLVVVRAASFAQQASAPTAGTAEVEAGRKLYVNACQRCHGIDLVTNGIGFDLRTFPQSDKKRFVRSVTDGIRAMPAWGTTLKPEQLDLLWAYVGAVNGWESASVQR
jgi:mono/diheme cytochrome c family protein